jgi:protein gp37
VHPKDLHLPLTWRSPRVVFVNSMSDLFHAKVPMDFVQRVFEVMAATPQHTYQILTKRAVRMAKLASRLDWPPNVWMGVSVENAQHLDRVDCLKRVPSAVRFVSAEPLLGPLGQVDLSDIDCWVIAGGESGAGARPVIPAWLTELRDLCLHQDVAFFFIVLRELNPPDTVDTRRNFNEMGIPLSRLTCGQD